MLKPISVPLKKIRLDGDTQTRASLHRETIAEYAEAYQRGDKFPLIVIYKEGEDLWLADGFHRFQALLKVEGDGGFINAEVKEGSREDALLYALASNDAHGLRRTRDDKIYAVRRVLSKPEWAERSTAWIAEACHVSESFVEGLRASTGRNGKRVGRDKKVRKAKVTAATDMGDAYEPPICKRCTRTGKVVDCKACARLAEREARKHKKAKVGSVKFAWAPFNHAFGVLVRQVDILGRAYKVKESPEANELRSLLQAWKDTFRAWYELTTSKPAPKEKASGQKTTV